MRNNLALRSLFDKTVCYNTLMDKKSLIVRQRSGFTVIELIVVIVVIGILAGIVIIAYSSWRTKIATDVVKSDLSQVVTTMENTRNFNKTGYPATLPPTLVASQDVQLVGGGRPGGKTYCVEATSTKLGSKKYYVSSKQKDPKEGNCTVTSVLFAGGSTTGYLNGVGTAAQFTRMEGMTIARDGTVYIADGGYLRRMKPDGSVSVYDGSGSDGFTSGAFPPEVFKGARGVAVDSTGNIYVLSINDDSIFKITPNGVKTVLNPSIHGTDLTLGSDSKFYALEGDNWSGKLFSVTMAGVATHVAGNATNASIDGQGTAASLYDPRGIVRTSDGTLYICENGSGKVRKVTSSYYVSTYASLSSSHPGGATSPIYGWCSAIAYDDAADLLYVLAGNKLQTIDASGVVRDIVTVGGDVAAMAIDPNGDILVASNIRLYKVVIP